MERAPPVSLPFKFHATSVHFVWFQRTPVERNGNRKLFMFMFMFFFFLFTWPVLGLAQVWPVLAGGVSTLYIHPKVSPLPRGAEGQRMCTSLHVRHTLTQGNRHAAYIRVYMDATKVSYPKIMDIIATKVGISHTLMWICTQPNQSHLLGLPAQSWYARVPMYLRCIYIY